MLTGANPVGSMLEAWRVEGAESGVVLPILPFRNHF